MDGTATTFAANDAGCIASLPACAGTATPLGPPIHVTEPQRVAYHEEPPNAGPHWPYWSPWGTLHAHTALPAERFIHNSEHQGVILLYRCDPAAGLPDGGSCDAMAAPLIAFANDGGPEDPLFASQGARRYLVTARPELPSSYAAIAWGWTLEMNDWDASAAACFAAAHLGAGPEPVTVDPDPFGCPQCFVP